MYVKVNSAIMQQIRQSLCKHTAKTARPQAVLEPVSLTIKKGNWDRAEQQEEHPAC